MDIAKEEVRKLLEKYEEKISSKLSLEKEPTERVVFSREYKEFKKEFMPKQLTIYEKLCAFSERILNIKPDRKKAQKLVDAINVSHLDVTPTGATSFAFLMPIFLAVFGSLFGFILTGGFFFVFFFVVVAAVLIYPLSQLPFFVANSWRMKASNQMVLSIFYVVTYMRHTSNLELAIQFAADHLSPPLSLDLRKVLWDVETGRYSNVKESLDNYLETWRKWNREYVESFHLVESSLYEGDEARRVELLDKGLDVILEETYEKMLHYAHNLKSPITMLHMLGVIMPILGLVILPLIVSFMTSETMTPGFIMLVIATLYNVALPIGVYYMGRVILSTRPTGYGDTDISEENPELKRYRNTIIKFGKSEIAINPMVFAIIIGGLLFFIGLSPVILHAMNVADFGFGEEADTSCGKKFCFMGYRGSKFNPDLVIGPYGIGASIMSLFITLAIGIGFGLYFRQRSVNVIKIREKAKNLEKEFASALFQLGGRLGDGIPAEMAVGRVADSMKGTTSGSFFEIASTNIRKLGMSVKDSIFNEKVGALVYFPSNIIRSSMKVLIESIKKGPKVAAQALMNVSRYIKEIHRVDERLKDLLADVISSMKSQIKFLTPVIAGIVIGITSMITTIITTLTQQLSKITTGEVAAGNLMDLFGDGVPTFYFQIIVGIYVIQIVYILTILSNGVENGEDRLNERYLLGQNLIKSTISYCFVSFIVMFLFNWIASKILIAGI